MDVGIDTEKKNPFEPGVGNPGMDETGAQIEMRNLDPYDSSSRRGSVDPTGHHPTYEETSFGGDISDTTPLLGREENVNTALEIIQSKFPNANTADSSFTARVDEYGRVNVRLNTNKGKYHLLFKTDGKLNDKLPKTIIKSLGQSAEEIVETNEEKIARSQKRKNS